MRLVEHYGVNVRLTDKHGHRALGKIKVDTGNSVIIKYIRELSYIHDLHVYLDSNLVAISYILIVSSLLYL